MNSLMLRSVATTCGIAAILLSASIAEGQRNLPRPPKRSFSNGPKPHPPAAAQGTRQATQEELADAVLGDTMNLLWDQTDHHFHEGEYNHAINICRIVVQGDPHNVEGFANAAWLLWSVGRNEEAAALLTDGIAANPTTYYMYDEMGRYWLTDRKDPKTALPYFEKAVTFDAPWTTWNGLAICYEKLDKWDKAVTAWEKATLFPQDLVANRRLKQARDRLAQQKPGQSGQ